MKKLISIVAPMYNEESLVQIYCEETMKSLESVADHYNYELVLVNDGSKDQTYMKMLEQQQMHPNNITLVCLSRNFGLEGAVKAGVEKAKGDAVIVMDADLQDPPSLLPEMIKKWENGADVVVCSRVKRSSDSLFKKFTANCYYKILDSLSGKLKLEKSAANFRLLSRKAVNTFLALPESNGVFRVMVPYVGMKTEIVEYDRDKRYAGKTKYNLKNMIPYALASITGISIEPLRKIFWFIPLDVMLFIGSIVGLLMTQDIWRAMWCVILVLSVLFGFMFVAVLIIAEYVGQIMLEVKGRPLSIIYEYSPCEVAKERE
ncbi:MAG: glycosyltransferase family 2 protein [Lachnospiraceae bacterium]|nr:glycosyltransferase family 2 protein [Lachnospiraceae bacterium]